jgi:hypothetical protein
MKEYGSRDKEQKTTTPAAVRQKKCSGTGCAVAGPNHESLTALQQMIAAGTKQPLQRIPIPEDDEKLTQRKANKTGIPDAVKQRAEAALNSDFSDVRIHANSAKAPAVGAIAYTQGTDIHFAPGSYNPSSGSGRSLLGHELTHVVQQAQGRVKPTTSVAGVPVNDNPSLEREADRLGGKI